VRWLDRLRGKKPDTWQVLAVPPGVVVGMVESDDPDLLTATQHDLTVMHGMYLGALEDRRGGLSGISSFSLEIMALRTLRELNMRAELKESA